MKSLPILSTVLALGLVFANQAHAFSITTTGTIQYGWDDLGIFGTDTGDLSGLGYSFTTSMDTSLNSYHYSDSATAQSQGGTDLDENSVQRVSYSVTVNGNTYNYTDWNTGNVVGVSNDPIHAYEHVEVVSEETHDNEDYSRIYVHQLVIDLGEFLTGTSIDQSVAYAVTSHNDLSRTLFMMGPDVYFYADITYVSLNPITAVPEPTTFSLLGLGLLGLGFVRRHMKSYIG